MAPDLPAAAASRATPLGATARNLSQLVYFLPRYGQYFVAVGTHFAPATGETETIEAATSAATMSARRVAGRPAVEVVMASN